jgi:hypothetical protein
VLGFGSRLWEGLEVLRLLELGLFSAAWGSWGSWDGMAKALERLVGLETAWLKLFLRA